jgi:hypothetical protein
LRVRLASLAIFPIRSFLFTRHLRCADFYQNPQWVSRHFPVSFSVSETTYCGAATIPQTIPRHQPCCRTGEYPRHKSRSVATRDTQQRLVAIGAPSPESA